MEMVAERVATSACND